MLTPGEPRDRRLGQNSFVFSQVGVRNVSGTNLIRNRSRRQFRSLTVMQYRLAVQHLSVIFSRTTHAIAAAGHGMIYDGVGRVTFWIHPC